MIHLAAWKTQNEDSLLCYEDHLYRDRVQYQTALPL